VLRRLLESQAKGAGHLPAAPRRNGVVVNSLVERHKIARPDVRAKRGDQFTFD
jgi:hypothetical protein